MSWYEIYGYITYLFVGYVLLYFVARKYSNRITNSKVSEEELADLSSINIRPEQIANCNELVSNSFLKTLTSSENIEQWEVEFCASFMRGLRHATDPKSKIPADRIFSHTLCVFRGNFTRMTELYANKTYFGNVTIDQKFIYSCLDLELIALRDFFMSIVHRNVYVGRDEKVNVLALA